MGEQNAHIVERAQEKLYRTNFIRSLSNLDILLFIAVSGYGLSIYFTLLPAFLMQYFSFFFFMTGLIFSYSLIMEWVLISKVKENFKKKNV